MAGHNKVTQDELDQRIEFVFHLQGMMLPKSVIKQQVRKRYGQDLSARQIERYMARARDLRISLSGMSKREHRMESDAFYRAMIADPSTPPTIRLACRQALDHLHGLDLPDPPEKGGDITVTQLMMEALKPFVEARVAVAERLRLAEMPLEDGRNGEANHQSTGNSGDAAGPVGT